MGIKRERATNWVDSFLILFFIFLLKRRSPSHKVESQIGVPGKRCSEIIYFSAIFTFSIDLLTAAFYPLSLQKWLSPADLDRLRA